MCRQKLEILNLGALHRATRFITVLFALLVAPAVLSGGEEATLSLPDLGGVPQSLHDYRGRIVVLNFWATWCIPCREEIPMLVSLESRFGPQVVQVIGVSVDDERTRRKVYGFVRRMKVNYPIWVGGTTEHMEKLGLGKAVPATVIIDRDGQVVGRILGTVSADDLNHRIEWLLGDRKSPAPPPLIDNFAKLAPDQEPPDQNHHEGKEHVHGSVGMEGASTVPS